MDLSRLKPEASNTVGILTGISALVTSFVLEALVDAHCHNSAFLFFYLKVLILSGKTQSRDFLSNGSRRRDDFFYPLLWSVSLVIVAVLLKPRIMKIAGFQESQNKK